MFTLLPERQRNNNKNMCVNTVDIVLKSVATVYVRSGIQYRCPLD